MKYQTLRTKLQYPNLGPDLIVREDLILQINQNINKPLTQIKAQTGYGKNLL